MYVEVADGMMDQLSNSSVTITYGSNFDFRHTVAGSSSSNIFMRKNVVAAAQSKLIILSGVGRDVIIQIVAKSLLVVSHGVNKARAAQFRFHRATSLEHVILVIYTLTSLSITFLRKTQHGFEFTMSVTPPHMLPTKLQVLTCRSGYQMPLTPIGR